MISRVTKSNWRVTNNKQQGIAKLNQAAPSP